MLGTDTVTGPVRPPPGIGVVNALLAARMSTKSISAAPIPASLLVRHLSAAVGERADGSRGYPSAHSLYPVNVFVAVGRVDDLRAGAYRFDSARHSLTPGAGGDHRRALAQSTLDAGWAAHCPAVLVLAADLDAADRAFHAQGPGRGARYCWAETGAVTQNVHLCAASLGLGTVFLGGVNDDAMRVAAGPLIGETHSVLGLMPLGFIPD
ncbi:SagB/ThcOx family dehydrogenase [Tomitella fengzijianii]|uniref:SagB/ThcOx family dehydrogenase n=1 Tax=Tomitella fengzijianii TaxID=2597660 RepID=A0A516WYY1_9ACTN|nr:SagB/ThcOx family dehydrogenase [Tomitella fengzijianii]QDQ96032.1 SagB/ThcOx family dehydrogenase [Tomitella fengzijianii]